jgi:hypothetical protein
MEMLPALSERYRNACGPRVIPFPNNISPNLNHFQASKNVFVLSSASLDTDFDSCARESVSPGRIPAIILRPQAAM